MKFQIMNIVWAAAHYAVLVPGVMLVCGLMIYRMMRTKRVVKLLAGSWATSLFGNISYVRQSIKIMLMTIGALFLVLALMRPQWDKNEELIAQEGRDLFIALD